MSAKPTRDADTVRHSLRLTQSYYSRAFDCPALIIHCECGWEARGPMPSVMGRWAAHSDGPDGGATAHCASCSQGQFFDSQGQFFDSGRTVCECRCHTLIDGSGSAT